MIAIIPTIPAGTIKHRIELATNTSSKSLPPYTAESQKVAQTATTPIRNRIRKGLT